MASMDNETSPQINPPSKLGARDAVLTTGELILMILNALIDHDEVDHSFVVRHSYILYRCMLINRSWCEWSRKLLWGELAWPHIAFDAVLQQFDVLEVGGHLLSLEDRVVRRPREAYVRYCYYASMVESVKIWNYTRKEDEEFCAKLDLFDLKRNVFPRLKKVDIMSPDSSFWFPLCFRNNSVTDISIWNAAYVGGIIRGVSQYCPRLKRFTVLCQLHETEVDLLQVHRFIYLTNLSIHVDDAHVDNFMRIILFISHNLTDLTLIFHGNLGISTLRRGRSFSLLKNLTLQGLFSVANSLDKLPTAPQLESLQLTSLSSDVSYTENVSNLFTAVAEYAKRSPFTRLLMSNVHSGRILFGRVDLNLVILSEIDRITDLSFTITSPSSVLFPDASRPMVWRQLRTLNLALGQATTPSFSLEDFFRIASQAPHLVDATVRMDLRAVASPALYVRPYPAVEKEGGCVELTSLERSFQSIEQFRAPSLRNLNFSSSHLYHEDQRFLFSSLRDLVPNLWISTVMLDSLFWHNPPSHEVALQCVKTHIRSTPPSVVEFAALLVDSSDFFASRVRVQYSNVTLPSGEAIFRFNVA